MSSSSRIFSSFNPAASAARRALLRRNAAIGAAGGFGFGVTMRHQCKQTAMRFDALAAPRTGAVPASERAYSSNRPGPQLDPETMKQASGGSIAGFLAGLTVSVFSRTLVLLVGLSVVAVQVAARYGIDLVEQLRVKQHVNNSKILSLLQKNPTFKLSFAVFFTMAAFMHF